MKKINHILVFALMFSALSAVLMSSYVYAQESTGEKQVKVKIVQKENGQTKTINKTFSTNDKAELESILKKYDINYDLDNMGDDEDVQIIIRKKKKGTDDENVAIDMEGVDDTAGGLTEKRTFLGVYFDYLPEADAKGKGYSSSGVLISKVIEGTAAEKAGLKAGDFITKFDGNELKTSDDFYNTIKSHKPGDEVAINYVRDGKKETTTATLGEKAFLKEMHFGPAHFNCNGNFPPPGGFVHCGMECKDMPFLGIAPDFPEDSKDQKGIKVNKVIEGSTAEDLGLKEGDVIYEVNGKPVNNLSDLRAVLNETGVGKSVKVTYERDGKKMRSEGTLKSRADSHAFNFPFDKDRMENCYKKYSQEFKDDANMSKEELKGHLERAIEKLEMELQNLKDELNNIDNDGNNAGEANQDVVKEINVKITMEDVSKEEAKIAGISADNTLAVDDLRFSPNPNNGRFDLSFTLPEKGKTTIRIFDLGNKEIYTETLKNFSGTYDKQIDISDNPKGIYFLQIVQNDQSLSKKIAIQ